MALGLGTPGSSLSDAELPALWSNPAFRSSTTSLTWASPGWEGHVGSTGISERDGSETSQGSAHSRADSWSRGSFLPSDREEGATACGNHKRGCTKRLSPREQRGDLPGGSPGLS